MGATSIRGRIAELERRLSGGGSGGRCPACRRPLSAVCYDEADARYESPRCAFCFAPLACLPLGPVKAYVGISPADWDGERP